LDDVAVQTEHNCICLRCYSRETGNAVTLPHKLRRELDALLTEDALPWGYR
jgi:hypothetical protein